ncbi:polymorphic toxin-type HINT domain-containing protein [Streptomyces fildesensis]|uniref:Polymorphic toxin-type HINT domain-containing protein n=1 Tax=Streptomyces fildesensis TaxID=375757 RepID=A0ABW8C8Y4_9ACTN
MTGKPVTFKDDTTKNRSGAARTTWPKAGSAVVDVLAPTPPQSRAATQGQATPASKAGTLPVSMVQAPQSKTPRLSTMATNPKVEVQLRDHADAQRAGIDGVLFTAEPVQQLAAPPVVNVGVDYTAFKDAYGGGWSSRLHLVQMPACALTTPDVPQCRTQTPLNSANDPVGQQVSATVQLNATAAPLLTQPAAKSFAAAPAATVLAATAGTSGSGSDFGATPLSATGTWNAGGASGDFNYSYPIAEPPVPGGLAPQVALGYSSQSVDGRMSGGNSQAGWIGDGWEYAPGSVTRTYMPCTEDPAGTAPKVGDQCWAGQLVHINLAGHSGDLVFDASKAQNWHVSNDGGEKVEYLKGATNGTYDGGYWKVTAADGTQYFFGLNRPKGWTTGKTETNSAWTVPVYGAHATDPCYNASGFANSRCDQAWQWNLDYVVDNHGNAMSYYYTKDTNYYGVNATSTGVAYTRSGSLHHIDYGFTDGSAYSADAPARVAFTPGDRCFATTCNPIADNKASWYDVPYDLTCAKNATCANHAPSFWTTNRLDKITTQILDAGTAKYTDVDSWALKQSFPDPGDGSDRSLFLDSIQRTGYTGTALPALPPTTFAGQQLANRFNTGNGYPNFTRYRISGITNESGGKTAVTYSSASCAHPADPSANVAPCYPVYWTPAGKTKPILDWFNKFLVKEVSDNDTTGGAPGNLTHYDYLGDAAWHYDDNELTKPAYRTWSQWRGYSRVQVRTGTVDKTLSETLYYQGMDGDKLPSGKRTATLSLLPGVTVAGAAASVPDREELTGQARQTVIYRGDGGAVDRSTVTDHWVGAPTATRTRAGLDPVTARMTRVESVRTTTAITSSTPTSWLTTRSDSGYDTATGAVVYTQDFGDITKPEQATCTTQTYAPANTTTNVRNLPAETETVAKPCGTGGSTSNGMAAPAGVDRAKDVISDARNYYDTAAPTTWPPALPTWPQDPPARGDVTLVAQATGYTSGAYTYQVSKAEQFDSTGRTIASWDQAGTKGTTAYTVTGGHTTGVKLTNALNQSVTSTLDPARGQTLSVVDANGGRTDATYDAFGRTTAVWNPGRLKSAGKSANTTFAYQITATAPSSVTTKSLLENGSYTTSIQLFDSLLRPRQTQDQSPSGGRVLSDTAYDSQGRKNVVNHAYWDGSTAPNTTLVTGTDQQITNQDLISYDGMGRVVLIRSMDMGHEISRTTTVYGGDRSTVIPPTGARPVTTVVDARGRTTELQHYTTEPTVTGDQVSGGNPIRTQYAYDALGRPSSITDAEQHVRTYGYDFLGRKITQTDPDTGTSLTSYNVNGQVKSATDAEGRSTAYAYDAFGRKTAQYNGPDTTSPLSASWTYDDPAVPNSAGRATSSTRYADGATGTKKYTQSVTGFTVSGKPLGTKITIPDAEGALAGTYPYSSYYTPNTELPSDTDIPAVGGLGEELVSQTYNVLDLPTAVGGDAALTTATTYDAFGRVAQTTLGNAGKRAIIGFDYDQHTGAINQIATDISTQTGRTDQVNYSRDKAGNVTGIRDTRQGGSVVDTQCFQNDLLGRLVQAWTVTGDCAAAPVEVGPNPALGGPDAYWTSWKFDNVGNQTQRTQHGVSGTAGNTVTDYTYGRPTDRTQQPDTLAETLTTAPDGTKTGTAYTYDKAGNTTSRTTTPGSDSLTWDGEGELVQLKSTGQDSASTYLYDADGTQLIRRDADGKATLFLPGQDVVLDPVTHTTSATRYYSLPGGESATRTSATTYSFILNDLQGTGQLLLDKNAASPTWRSYTPYGAPRTTSSTPWPGSEGFVGGTDDKNTGLTLLGARHYDADIGRFVSADPVFEATDPDQMGGYAYAGSNPVTKSDPSGLMNAADCATYACWQSITEASRADNMRRAQSTCTTAECARSILGSDCHCTGTSTYTKPSGGTHSGGSSSFLHGLKKFATHPIDTGANFVKKHKVVIVSTIVALEVGAACYAAAGGAGAVSGGAGFGLAVGCGALAGAAQSAVENAMNPNGDHSVTGYANSVLTGAVVGAVTGGVFHGAATLAAKALKPLADKVAPAVKSAIAKLGGKCNSFLANTAVAMADGSTKPIQFITAGDQVLATDPVTKDTRTEKVTNTIVTDADKDFTRVTAHTESGATATITATAHHPYWDDKSKRWINAADLTPGAELRTPDGSILTVTKVETTRETHRTYNLTVANLHTYYVLAGATPVLVHNCDVALGWQNKGKLDGWAKQNGFTTYSNTSPRDYAQIVEKAVADPNVTLHVNMTGLNELGGFMAAAQRGLTAGEAGRATDYELSMITRSLANGQRGWSSIKFYSPTGPNGSMVLDGDVPMPDLSLLRGELSRVKGSVIGYCHC